MIIFTPIMAIRSSEMSVLTRAKQRNIRENGILLDLAEDYSSIYSINIFRTLSQQFPCQIINFNSLCHHILQKTTNGGPVTPHNAADVGCSRPYQA
jgi:hypothetical protein